MNTDKNINEALKMLGTSPFKNILFVGNPGTGVLSHLMRTLRFPCISLANHSAFPDELVKQEVKSKVSHVVFDEVDRIPYHNLSSLVELLEDQSFSKVLVTHNINEVHPSIVHRCLIFNLTK